MESSGVNPWAPVIEKTDRGNSLICESERESSGLTSMGHKRGRNQGNHILQCILNFDVSESPEHGSILGEWVGTLSQPSPFPTGKILPLNPPSRRVDSSDLSTGPPDCRDQAHRKVSTGGRGVRTYFAWRSSSPRPVKSSATFVSRLPTPGGCWVGRTALRMRSKMMGAYHRWTRNQLGNPRGLRRGRPDAAAIGVAGGGGGSDLPVAGCVVEEGVDGQVPPHGVLLWKRVGMEVPTLIPPPGGGCEKGGGRIMVQETSWL